MVNMTKRQMDGWEPTSAGGFRRQRGLAQKTGNATEASEQAEGIARSGVEDGVGGAEYSEEHFRYTEEVGGSNPSPATRETVAHVWKKAGRNSGKRARLASLVKRTARGASGGRSPVVRYFGREALGLPTCPYLIRWRVETPWFSVRLHHWLGPDDDRAQHDHPWSFTTFVLKGGYTDVHPGPCGRCRGTGDLWECPKCAGTGEVMVSEHLRAPAVQYRPAEHQHTVFPDEGGCWTVIFTSAKKRQWGFWVKGKFVKSYRYFYKYGHHPCD